MLFTSSVISITSSVRLVTSSVILATLADTLHIIALNLLRIVFKPSHVFTSVQGSGVLSYVTALVPNIVVLFI
jgi:hypothetical protein